LQLLFSIHIDSNLICIRRWIYCARRKNVCQWYLFEFVWFK